MFGIRTWDCKMVGADETTDLWRECLRDILQCNPWSQYHKKNLEYRAAMLC